jgi:hypothetical protein
MAENLQVHSLCAPELCWIGFNDRQTEGTWVWSDGSPAEFGSFLGGVAPWNPGQPDNMGFGPQDSDGAYMAPSTTDSFMAGSWDDMPSSTAVAFVCRDAPSPPRAPPPPKVLTSYPFELVPQRKSWGDAEAHCADKGKKLASIRTPEENVLAWNLCHPDDCWVGFSDREQEGRWSWSDGWPAEAWPRGAQVSLTTEVTRLTTATPRISGRSPTST